MVVTDLKDKDLAFSALHACFHYAQKHDFTLALTILPSTAELLRRCKKNSLRKVTSVSISVEAYESTLSSAPTQWPSELDRIDLAGICPGTLSLQIQLELLLNRRGTLPLGLKFLEILPSPSHFVFSRRRCLSPLKKGAAVEQALLGVLDKGPVLFRLVIPRSMLSSAVQKRCKERGIELFAAGRAGKRRVV